MSRWIDTFDSHAFRPIWNQLKSTLEETEVDDETIFTSVLELSRLKKVVQFVDDLLDNIDPELVPLSTWDNFQEQAAPCLEQISAFNSSRNIRNIMRANAHADNLVTYVRPYVVAVSKAGKAMQSALRSYSETVDTYLQSFQNRGSGILKNLGENQIKSATAFNAINDMQLSIKEFEEELFQLESDESGLADKIRTTFDNSNELRDEISAFHYKLLVSDEDSPSVRQQVLEVKDSILLTKAEAIAESDSMSTKISELNKFYIKIFGKIVNDQEDGSESMSPGLKQELEVRVQELEGFETRQKMKYDALTKQIEDLIPGATSAGLASAYSEMKNSYNESIKNSSRLFYASIAVLVLTAFISVINDAGLWYISFIQVTGWEQMFVVVLNKLPFYGPVLWLAFYATRRRSQNQRLQQEYAHKEALAKSYDSYRKQLQELGDEDGEMQKAFIKKAIDAISYNASETLDAKHSSDNPSSEILKKLTRTGQNQSN